MTNKEILRATNKYMLMQEAGGAATTAHTGHYAGMGAKLTTMMGFGVGTIFNVGIDTTTVALIGGAVVGTGAAGGIYVGLRRRGRKKP